MVGVSVLAFLALPHISGATMLYAMVFIVYYCYGTQLSVFASTTGDFFGTKNLGVNYGLVFFGVGRRRGHRPDHRRTAFRCLRELHQRLLRRIGDLPPGAGEPAAREAARSSVAAGVGVVKGTSKAA